MFAFSIVNSKLASDIIITVTAYNSMLELERGQNVKSQLSSLILISYSQKCNLFL